MFLNDTTKQVQEMVRQFADTKIRPIANELDQDMRFPEEVYQQMTELGLFGICVPNELGGAGFDTLTYAVVMEELSRGYASVADQCGLVELIATLLMQHGNEQQRDIWLKPILQMQKKVAYCITESEAGTDVSGIKTFAKRDRENWILNGSKLWIHNAPIADLGFVLARTNKEAGHRGMSIFVVDLNAPGVERGKIEHKMGQRASLVGGLSFDNVRLPANTLLGEEGKGFHIMMSVLDKGRVGIAALATGITQAGLESALQYAQDRKQFGKSISEFQGVQWLLADMATDIEAARLLIHQAAMKIDQGENATKSCSIAKCFSGDMAVKRTSDAVQIFGGSGYIQGFEVERLYRDAKITQIYEGTNQIQRMIIARELLKHGVN